MISILQKPQNNTDFFCFEIFLIMNFINILTLKAIQPAQDEIEANPMARSAKLRAAEKI